MRDARTKNKPEPKVQPKTTHVKQLPPDIKKGLDEVEREVKKEKQR